MYIPKDPKYEPLYGATVFIYPLKSNDLSEGEKKLAQKEDTKKLGCFTMLPRRMRRSRRRRQWISLVLVTWVGSSVMTFGG